MAMTDAVKEQRRGKFTASQIYLLMAGMGGYVTCEFSTDYQVFEKIVKNGVTEHIPMMEAHKTKKCWRKDESYLPESADTYIIRVITELLDSEPTEAPTTRSMQYGIDNEPLAIAELMNNGYMLELTGDNQFFFHDEHSGATPDAVEYGDDGFSIVRVHDVKCPNSDTHTFNCLRVQSADDLRVHYPVYYWQGMMQMLHTGATEFNWHSFRATANKRLHTVEVPRDEQSLNLLKKRIALAVARKSLYLEELLK